MNFDKISTINIKPNLITLIPCDVDQFYYVNIIYLERNKISILPKEIASPKIHQLSLCHNRLQRLPREIKHCVNLLSLHIDNNLLSNLPIEIINLKKLILLSIHNNNFSCDRMCRYNSASNKIRYILHQLPHILV